MCFGEKNVEEEHGVGSAVCFQFVCGQKQLIIEFKSFNLGAFSVAFRMKVNLVFYTFTFRVKSWMESEVTLNKNTNS